MRDDDIDDFADIDDDMLDDDEDESAKRRNAFETITTFFNETPHKVFESPDYYKHAVAGEGAASNRLHDLVSKYVKTTDPKDRTAIRQSIIPAYWDFFLSAARKAGRFSAPKRYLLRFGLLLPAFLTPELRQFFATIIDENTYGEPVFYVDEWLSAIAAGKLSLSATDEAPAAKKTVNITQLKIRAEDKVNNAKNFFSIKAQERSAAEEAIQSTIEVLFSHDDIQDDGLEDYGEPLTESQRKDLTMIGEKFKELFKVDRELAKFLSDYRASVASLNEIIEQEENQAESDVDLGDIATEADTVRKMNKMTIDRQGNFFPLLAKEYYFCTPRDIGNRENVLMTMKWIESIDPEAFYRVYKSQTMRIVPYTLLVPSYGSKGFCWEPFDRYNRASSRGRIVVPMYAKSLKIAVASAVADLRWQVAKEKASYYWMEEGLTGLYYQWFSAQKLKGDIKNYFVADYLIWLGKESTGTQALPKEVRAAFWRYMPFPQPLKDELKGRSMAYAELYARDENRKLSQ